MGIDGGGSGVRVVIATPDLAICGQSEGPAANPSVIGTDAAAVTIQAAMRAALDAAGLAAGSAWRARRPHIPPAG